ncbi:MAG: hypothetical protein JRH14_02920 [Deltaproteobacteria bacterium]|nr:hypothetical protein [Deltaproteobacteria bacterium]
MKKDIPEKEEILQVLQAHSPRAMHVGALCERLDVSRGAKEDRPAPIATCRRESRP